MEREREPNQYTVFRELYESLLIHNLSRQETFTLASEEFERQHRFRPYKNNYCFKSMTSRVRKKEKRKFI